MEALGVAGIVALCALLLSAWGLRRQEQRAYTDNLEEQVRFSAAEKRDLLRDIATLKDAVMKCEREKNEQQREMVRLWNKTDRLEREVRRLGGTIE